MARAAALAALAFVAAAVQCAALGAPQPAGLAHATEVYASLLQGSPRVSVGGYVTPDGFAPLKPNEVLVALSVGGVHRRVTRPLPDNSWSFKDVPPGTHSLEVIADGFEVPLVRVDVAAEDGRVRFARADAPTRSLRAPLVLGPTQRVAYAVPQQPWTLRSLLSNPMYVIMGLMAVMMVLMPRLMENIDPEELKQMQEQMGKGGTLGLLQGALMGDTPPPPKKKALEGGAAPSSSSGGGSSKKKH